MKILLGEISPWMLGAERRLPPRLYGLEAVPPMTTRSVQPRPETAVYQPVINEVRLSITPLSIRVRLDNSSEGSSSSADLNEMLASTNTFPNLRGRKARNSRRTNTPFVLPILLPSFQTLQLDSRESSEFFSLDQHMLTSCSNSNSNSKSNSNNSLLPFKPPTVSS